MQLTGQEIIKEGIVGNYADNAIQQQGVDVRIDRLFFLSGVGLIPVEGKTKLPVAKEIEASDVYAELEGREGFLLLPGYYEVELKESINVPNNRVLHFKSRSSLVRCGAQVRSGQFDAGFKTDKAGCFITVERAIYVQRGARIAQAIVFDSNQVENTYNGQYQRDMQRNGSVG